MRATRISTTLFTIAYWLVGSAIAAEQLKEGTANIENSTALVISQTQAILLVSTLGACIACIYMVFSSEGAFKRLLISAILLLPPPRWRSSVT